MANLPTDIAGKSVDEVLANAGGKNVLIPEGIYKAMFVEGNIVENSKKTGHLLVMKAVITEGQYAQTEMITRMNIVHENKTTETIGRQELARIAKAVGLSTTPNNSDALLRKPLLIAVKTEKSNGTYTNNEGAQVPYPDRSAIDSKGYKPLPAVGTSAPAAATADAPAASMPWMN